MLRQLQDLDVFNLQEVQEDLVWLTLLPLTPTRV